MLNDWNSALFQTHAKHAARVAAVVVALYAAKAAFSLCANKVKESNFRREIQKQKKDVVYVYGWARRPGTLGMSTPVLRLETYLRLERIPYVYVPLLSTDKSPTGRLPFVVYNGEVIADSEFIRIFCEEKIAKKKLSDRFTPEQNALARTVRRMVEGSLTQGFYRAIIVDNPAALFEAFAEMTGYPLFIIKIFVSQHRQRIISILNAVGYGDLTDKEYRFELLEDVKALETMLQGKKFLLGDSPCCYDCTVFASVHLALGAKTPQVPIEAFNYLHQSKVFQEYNARMLALAFPDAEKIYAMPNKTVQDFTVVAGN